MNFYSLLFFAQKEETMAKSIVEQIKNTQMELEKSKKSLSQLKHKKDKIITRNSNVERKARTRKLIERGAILESINPSINLLSNEQLLEYLQLVLRTEVSRILLEDIVQANLS